MDGLPFDVLGVGSGNGVSLDVEVVFAPDGAAPALTEQLGVPVRPTPALTPTG